MRIVPLIIDKINYSPRLWIIVVMSLVYLIKVVVFNETSSDRLWNKGDALFYQFIAESLIKDGDLDLSNNHRSLHLYDEGYFALSQYGYPTAKQSPLMSIIALPFRMLIGPVGTLWFNILCSLGILLILYELVLFWVRPAVGVLTVWFVGIVSVLFRYAFNFSPDVFSCFLLLGLILAVFRHSWWWVGLLAGLAISTKIGNAIVVGPILFYLLWDVAPKGIPQIMMSFGKVAVTFLMAILPFGFYNYWLFGNPMTTGYQAILTMNDGVLTTVSHTNDFNIPFFKGLFTLLFNGQNGLVKDNFLLVIPFLIGLWFVPKIGKKRWMLFLMIVLIQMGFYACYDHQLASHLGNRFLLLSIALMAVPISWSLEALYITMAPKYFKD